MSILRQLAKIALTSFTSYWEKLKDDHIHVACPAHHLRHRISKCYTCDSIGLVKRTLRQFSITCPHCQGVGCQYQGMHFELKQISAALLAQKALNGRRVVTERFESVCLGGTVQVVEHSITFVC